MEKGHEIQEDFAKIRKGVRERAGKGKGKEEGKGNRRVGQYSVKKLQDRGKNECTGYLQSLSWNEEVSQETRRLRVEARHCEP